MDLRSKVHRYVNLERRFQAEGSEFLFLLGHKSRCLYICSLKKSICGITGEEEKGTKKEAVGRDCDLRIFLPIFPSIPKNSSFLQISGTLSMFCICKPVNLPS